ncbi:MAG TPA: SRPBCC family protein [Xanthobacteraceae bacterium]|nr:SRPBCC family protein [Xanthobacteraceae bacterium]
MRPLDEFLTDEDRIAIRAPISQARTFPQVAYRSQEFFELEVAHVFSQNWVAVGFAAGLPHVGDAAPFEIFGIPLLITRAEDNAIRVFHNVGAHDGCPIVVTRQSRVAVIEGPYHGWQYNLRGELVKAPFWDGTPNPNPSTLRKQSANLKEIRSGIWNDIIFIDLSGKCPALTVSLAPLIALFEDCDFSTLEMANDSADGDGIHRFVAKANWKPLWENYAPNVYHEAFVHAQYRRSAHVPRVDSQGRKTYREINDGIVKGLAFEAASVTNTYPDVDFPRIKSRATGSPVTTSFILNIYPNATFLAFPTHVRISILAPEDAGNTQWLIASYYADGSAQDPAYKEMRQRSIDGSVRARIEDDRVCEAVQRARRSPAYRSLFYSPFWDQMHYDFNKMVLNDLERSLP